MDGLRSPSLTHSSTSTSSRTRSSSLWSAYSERSIGAFFPPVVLSPRTPREQVRELWVDDDEPARSRSPASPARALSPTYSPTSPVRKDVDRSIAADGELPAFASAGHPPLRGPAADAALRMPADAAASTASGALQISTKDEVDVGALSIAPARLPAASGSGQRSLSRTYSPTSPARQLSLAYSATSPGRSPTGPSARSPRPSGSSRPVERSSHAPLPPPLPASRREALSPRASTSHRAPVPASYYAPQPASYRAPPSLPGYVLPQPTSHEAPMPVYASAPATYYPPAPIPGYGQAPTSYHQAPTSYYLAPSPVYYAPPPPSYYAPPPMPPHAPQPPPPPSSYQHPSPYSTRGDRRYAPYGGASLLAWLAQRRERDWNQQPSSSSYVDRAPREAPWSLRPARWEGEPQVSRGWRDEEDERQRPDGRRQLDDGDRDWRRTPTANHASSSTRAGPSYDYYSGDGSSGRRW